MNVPDDLPVGLVNALQSLDDVEDLLHAVLWLHGREDPEGEGAAMALGDLRELVRVVDPTLVDLWHGDGTSITPEGERWLRRQLEGLR